MTSPQALEILDLRHFTARQLRPLLTLQAQVWQSRLRWVYRDATELLLQYLDSQMLPGFVALDRGRICGYTFCVYEGHKAVIGDIFSDCEDRSDRSLEIAQTLAKHLLEMMNASPDVMRIEAQLLLYDSGVLPTFFEGSTFTTYPRLFLERALDTTHVSAIPIPVGLELCGWTMAAYQATAELIRRAYVGHVDANINDQYRTLEGAQRFLHNIVRFPGCGTFDPAASWFLRDPRTQALVAVILCSRVAPDVAHVTQLCVDVGMRGKGLGEALIEVCLQTLPKRGYQAVTLTVSEQNKAAVSLYRKAGFQTRQRFDALVFEKQIKPVPYRVL